MVADHFGRHVIANALEGVVIEDIVDTQQSAQIAESAAVPVSAPAETVGQSTLHLAVGIRRGSIVEVARQNYRIGRRIRLGADFTHLRGTNPAVAVHGAEHRIDRGFPVVVLLEAAAQLGDARSLEMHRKNAQRISLHEQVGAQVVVAGIGEPDVFAVEDRIAAGDGSVALGNEIGHPARKECADAVGRELAVVEKLLQT